MPEQSKTVACTNTTCKYYNIKRTIWAQLHHPALHAWPTLTCAECGQPPTTITPPTPQ